jgi:hypothetical protein
MRPLEEQPESNKVARQHPCLFLVLIVAKVRSHLPVLLREVEHSIENEERQSAAEAHRYILSLGFPITGKPVQGSIESGIDAVANTEQR